MTDPSKRLRVAAAQMKFANSIPKNLGKIETATLDAVNQKADAVLFPECATTGYAFDFKALKPGQIREALVFIGNLAARHHVNILAGSPVFWNSQWQNCLVAFDRMGRVIHCY